MRICIICENAIRIGVNAVQDSDYTFYYINEKQYNNIPNMYIRNVAMYCDALATLLQVYYEDENFIIYPHPRKYLTTSLDSIIPILDICILDRKHEHYREILSKYFKQIIITDNVLETLRKLV